MLQGYCSVFTVACYGEPRGAVAFPDISIMRCCPPMHQHRRREDRIIIQTVLKETLLLTFVLLGT